MKKVWKNSSKHNLRKRDTISVSIFIYMFPFFLGQRVGYKIKSQRKVCTLQKFYVMHKPLRQVHQQYNILAKINCIQNNIFISIPLNIPSWLWIENVFQKC